MPTKLATPAAIRARAARMVMDDAAKLEHIAMTCDDLMASEISALKVRVDGLRELAREIYAMPLESEGK